MWMKSTLHYGTRTSTYVNTNKLMTDECYGIGKTHHNKKGSEKLAYRQVKQSKMFSLNQKLQ